MPLAQPCHTPPRPDEHYRAFADAIPHPVWVTDPDGETEYVNRQWTEYTGLAVVEARGPGWEQVVHPDDLPEVRRRWAEAVAAGVPFQAELRLRRADGEYRWFLGRAAPDRDRHGRVARWVGTCTDIHDRRAAEAAPFWSEALLRLVWDGAADGVRLTDEHGTVVMANPAYCRLVGLPPDRVLGRPMADVYAPGRRAAAMAGHRDWFDGTPTRIRREVEVELWDGRRRCFEAADALLTVPAEPALLLTILRDVTDQRGAEGEVRAWKARYEAAIRAGGQMLYDRDTVTNVFVWAGSCEAALGLTPAEMPTDLGGWLDRVHPDDRPAVEAETERVAATGNPFGMEYRVRREDGTYAAVLDQGHFIADPGGRPTRVVGFVADVSDRKRLEEQLRQAQKLEAVGRLAGGVAHDFNNLLTVINGYSDLALAALPPGHPARPSVEQVARAGDRAAVLTRQLLAFGRKQILRQRVLDLADLVTDLGAMLRRLIGEDVRLVTECVPGLWPVRADPGQLGQVVVNLAVNARDAMPDGGTLTVRVGNAPLPGGRTARGSDVRPGPYVVLSVSDTGSGMTDEVKARVFEPFFTTKSPGAGTGLGLATVYGIVKQSGGHVGVESAVGRGTTVRVYLPARVGAVPDAPHPAAVGNLPRGTETVLLVEDEDGVRSLARRTLAGLGYAVLEAATGERAVAAAWDHPGPIHLLVTDVVMPGMGGQALAAELCGHHPGLQVLYTSGYTDDVVKHGVGQEKADFLPKPYTPADLARKVRAVLDAPSG
jgi:PAS domain S-box-containing protein